MKNRLFMRLTSALLALTLSAAMSTTVFAANAETFTDVPSTHFAYEAITHYTNEGIISGTSVNTFSPDDSISYAEFITVLMRALHPEKIYTAKAGTPWYTPYLNEAYRYGLLDVSDVLQDGGKMSTLPHTIVSWQNGLSTIMKSYFGHAVIHATGAENCYDVTKYQREDQPYIKAAIALGIYTPCEDDTAKTAMTRADAMLWLYRASQLGEVQFQEESKENFITWETRYDYDASAGKSIPSRLIAQIDNIPSDIMIDFIRSGWNIKIVEAAEEYYSDKTASIAALCSFSRKTIFVEAKTFTPSYPKSSLSHEIGHYVQNRLKITDVADILFQLEADPLSEATKTSYCRANEAEFFAEVSQMLLFYSPEKLATAKAAAPNSFAYMEAVLRAPITNGRLSTTEEITTLEIHIRTLATAK